MCEKYLLGLTRNRLFEFENAVLFVGRFPSEPNEAECNKALKMLCVKEPVVTGSVSLCDDSSAELVLNSVEQRFVFSDKTCEQIKKDYDLSGLDFTSKVFEFTVSSDNWFIIAGHTAVADGKSLLRLAMCFADFYTRKSLSVEASGVCTFPDVSALPSDVLSPLTDKLSAELDNRWNKIKCCFSVADYKSAEQSFRENRSEKGELQYIISEAELEKLNCFCRENNIDFSSLVAYGFYKNLCEKVRLPRKSQKLCPAVDRRFFVNGAEFCNVGAFDGNVSVALSKKEELLPPEEQAKAFHFSCYKAATSCYKSFYEEALLIKISPSYCDSAYMYLAGKLNHKYCKKLAEDYSCKNTKLCRYFSVNLEQDYWSSLGFFEKPFVYEPFKSRFLTMLSLAFSQEEARISFRYDVGYLSLADATEIGEGAIKTLSQF